MTNITEEEINSRAAEGEDDFWLVRRFLIEAWGLMPPFFNWDIRRWDGSYFHNKQPGWDERWDGGKAVRLWETQNGRLVAAAHPEGKGDAWLEVHRDWRGLEDKMLDWAEANLAKPGEDDRRQLKVFAWEYDEQRQKLLASRGYARTDEGEVVRSKPYTDDAEPATRLPEGYRLHTVRPGNLEDCERYAALLNAAFRRTFHSAQELMTFTTKSPSFREELELVVVAPDGSFAALAGMIYDEDNRFGLFEPVCAHPESRRLGLTRKLMLEDWRRVRELGAEECYVGTGIGMPANRFYDSVGFKVINTGWLWAKQL